MNAPTGKVFLTAEWRHLAMLNYRADPALLAPLVPAGTELDSWNGHTFLSVVGFLFQRTRVAGWPVPFHRNFEEVNLRFYVRRRADDGWRRGVVFIKEIVPRAAIAFVARKFYHEPYVALPMAHHIATADGVVAAVEYAWRFAGQRHAVTLTTQGPARELIPGSEAEFITEHYWGYNRQPDGTTLEYRVEHPRWRVQAAAARLEGEVARLYGEAFRDCLRGGPASAFLAEGSAVTVFQGFRVAP